jgi:hypothetical protein
MFLSNLYRIDNGQKKNVPGAIPGERFTLLIYEEKMN